MAIQMDLSCIIALVFVFISEVLGFFHYKNVFDRLSDFNMEQYKSLDPQYLESQWYIRTSNPGILNAANMFKAISLFALLLPIMQVAWVLSDGGKRHLTSLVAICILAFSGGFCELLANLLNVGIHNTEKWIVDSFNLSDWNDEDDGVGWRVLEIANLSVRGMMTWIDALEWLCIFFIMIILFFTVRYERNFNNSPFGTKWAALGLVFGTLGLFEFIAEMLRLQNWMTFTRVALVFSIINTWILLPVWLFVLSRQLSISKASFEDWKTTELVEQQRSMQPLNTDVNHIIDTTTN